MSAGQVVFGGAPIGDTQQAVITLTPTQFTSLTTAAAQAIQVIPAQGIGKLILVENTVCNLQYGGVAYTTGTGSLVCSYNNSGTLSQAQVIALTAMLTSVASALSLGFGSDNGTTTNPMNNGVNNPLVLNLSAGSSYVTGNSPIFIIIRYRVLSVA